MITPRKRFSQNFLKDQNIIGNIIRQIDPKSTDSLIEIGPGFGALTERLIQNVNTLQVIEIDRDAIAHLRTKFPNEAQFVIHQGDILKFDLSTLADPPLRIVGNLPYHISTPILFHCLEYAKLIKDMHFMLQLEVIERMCAPPGSKTYGRLSVMVQYYCDAQHLFNVPRTAFWPEPNVESAIVRLIPHQQPIYTVPDEKLFADIVRNAFNQRRKTLRNSLKGLIPPEIMSQIDIDWSNRPEQLSVKDFAKLCQDLHTLV